MKCPFCNEEIKDPLHLNKFHYPVIRSRIEIFTMLKNELEKDYEKLKKIDDKEAEKLANEIIEAIK